MLLLHSISNCIVEMTIETQYYVEMQEAIELSIMQFKAYLSRARRVAHE